MYPYLASYHTIYAKVRYTGNWVYCARYTLDIYPCSLWYLGITSLKCTCVCTAVLPCTLYSSGITSVRTIYIYMHTRWYTVYYTKSTFSILPYSLSCLGYYPIAYGAWV